MARPKKKAVERKIDIFVILEALDHGDMSVYDQIAADPGALAEFRKEIGYILPIWMTGSARDSDHAELIERFNRYANQNWFSLYQHPRIQTKLLATVGLGRKVNHRFSRVRGARKDSPILNLLRLTHPDIRLEEAQLWVNKNSEQQMLDRARAHGWQEDQMDDLQKNYAEMKTR